MNMHSPTIPIKLTDRQEQFCQQILGAKSAAEAYRIAYGVGQKVSEAAGPRLLGSVRVKARIAQLREFESASQRVTLPFLTAGLYRAARLAEATSQPSAMAQALLGVAKLHGFLVDRQQLDVLVRRPSPSPESPDEMSEEQWLAAHSIPQVTTTIDLEPEGSEPSEYSISIEPEPQVEQKDE